eukprot:ANDGO_08144.mRNA.1 Abhydrolase domain-containing protein
MSVSMDISLHVSRNSSPRFIEALNTVFPTSGMCENGVPSVPSSSILVPHFASVPFWMCSNIMQDALASLFKPARIFKFSRSLLSTPDGGQVAVDEPESDLEKPASAPLVFVLTGLTGSSEARYVQKFLNHVGTTMPDARSVVFTYRGCGGLSFTSPRSYCAADTADVRLGIEEVCRKYPDAPKAIVGFSLGSILLLKYLAEEGNRAPFLCACSVSNPFNLVKSSENLLRVPYRWIHTPILAAGLRKLARDNQQMLSQNELVDLENAMNAKSVREFDEYVTRRIFGFKNVDEYYEAASPVKFIHEVKTPLLCINAVDDPVAPVQFLPRSVVQEETADVALVETSHGSHLSFITGTAFKVDNVSAADRMICRFFHKFLFASNHE